MKEPTRNVLTQEEIETELRFYNKADIRSSATSLLALSLLLLPLTAICIYAAVSESPHPAVTVLLLLLTAVIPTPVFIFFAVFLRSFGEKRLLDRGGFEITTRELLYKEERVVQRHTELFLSFDGFEDACVPSTTYDLASEGDPFYLVSYKGKKKISLLYPAKLYELQK